MALLANDWIISILGVKTMPEIQKCVGAKVLTKSSFLTQISGSSKQRRQYFSETLVAEQFFHKET